MISVIIYGRNDSHGYNLHKRVAISLNCIAEVLTDRNDEIIFVDYNTPDDFITFPEAIADTLTERCKKMLRIIRVRPKFHNKYFKATTDLVALEPVSRNVGFRASNPENRWMLCTNTDMVFAPHDPSKSLSDIVADLPDGFYELPRFEMPDVLWEKLDRLKPQENIRLMKEWGTRYHINEIIEKMKFIRFDAPGDFQLFTRKDIFAIQGFDERHNLGWHMDSNLCMRFSLLYGRNESLHEKLAGWHCNHTRTQSITHSSGRKTNKWYDVAVNIVRPDLPHQKDSWGLAGEKLEEIRLTDQREKVIKALERLIPTPQVEPDYRPFIGEEWISCRPEHLKPYLVDVLYPLARDSVAGYMGYSRDFFEGFVAVWQELGFTGPIHLVGRRQLPEFRKVKGMENMRALSLEEADEQCTLFLSDFSPWDSKKHRLNNDDNQHMLPVLHQMLEFERARTASPTHTLRKFIIINAVQSQVSNIMLAYTNMQGAPFSMRIRHGFVVPLKKAKAS